MLILATSALQMRRDGVISRNSQLITRNRNFYWTTIAIYLTNFYYFCAKRSTLLLQS